MRIPVKILLPEDNDSWRCEGFCIPACVGNFGTEMSRFATHRLFNLDDFDNNYVKDVKLREGEKLYRYETDACKIAGMKPLVKVNENNGMVYYLSEEGVELDQPLFSRKGVQMEWLNIFKKVKKPGSIYY